MTDRELMQQALEALVYMTKGTIHGGNDLTKAAITALRERLAQHKALDKLVAIDQELGMFEQPVQEPVAMRYDFDGYGYKYIDSGSGSNWQTRIKDAEPLYAAPVVPVQEPVAREHITDGSPCWCEPETNYKDPETGISVIVHKEPQ